MEWSGRPVWHHFNETGVTATLGAAMNLHIELQDIALGIFRSRTFNLPALSSSATDLDGSNMRSEMADMHNRDHV